MKKSILFSVVTVALVILSVATDRYTEVRNLEIDKDDIAVTESVNKEVAEADVSEQNKTLIVKEKVQKVTETEKEVGEKLERPKFKNPLGDLESELLDYIYKYCIENDISYELMLAIAYVESTFQPDAISYDGSSVGLYQIKKSNASWLGELAGIDNPDLFDPKTSFRLAVAHLKYTDDYWTKQGYSEEDRLWLNVVSYNRGVQGTKNWIKKHGWKNGYFDKVYDTKIKLEQDVIL